MILVSDGERAVQPPVRPLFSHMETNHVGDKGDLAHCAGVFRYSRAACRETSCKNANANDSCEAQAVRCEFGTGEGKEGPRKPECSHPALLCDGFQTHSISSSNSGERTPDDGACAQLPCRTIRLLC